MRIDDVVLDGGLAQNPDGSWTVACVFHKVASEKEAQALSAWLEDVVASRLHEISDITAVSGKRPPGLQ